MDALENLLFKKLLVVVLDLAYLALGIGMNPEMCADPKRKKAMRKHTHGLGRLKRESRGRRGGMLSSHAF